MPHGAHPAPAPVMPALGRRTVPPLRHAVHAWLVAQRQPVAGQQVRDRFGVEGLLALLELEARSQAVYSRSLGGWSTVRFGVLAADSADTWHRVAALSLEGVAHTRCGLALQRPPFAGCGDATCAACG